MRRSAGPGTVGDMTLHEAAAAHLDRLFPDLDEVSLAMLTDEVVGHLIETAEAVLARA